MSNYFTYRPLLKIIMEALTSSLIGLIGYFLSKQLLGKTSKKTKYKIERISIAVGIFLAIALQICIDYCTNWF